MRFWRKKIDWSKYTKPVPIKEEPDTREYPYMEKVPRESGKLSNREYILNMKVCKDHIELEKEVMMIALLMDIRDRLDSLVEGINKNIEE